MTKYVFVRHGFYKKLKGDKDRGVLTAKGKKQVLLAAQRIKKIYQVSEVLSSELVRAVETAGVITEHLNLAPAQTHAFFNECLPALSNEYKREWDLQQPRALVEESEVQFSDAYRFLFDPIPRKYKDQTVVICGHGNFIRAFVYHCLGVAKTLWTQADHHHAGITVLGVEPTDTVPRLLCFNETGHLSPAMRTIDI